MDEKKLVDLAVEMGFANAALVDTRDIEFIPAFRPLCEENLCGKYGVNYCCPPDCGTVAEMEARVRRWPRAILLQTLWDIDDPLDERQTKPAKGKHNKLTREWIDRAGIPTLITRLTGDINQVQNGVNLALRLLLRSPFVVFGASGCNLCNPCAIVEGKPCRFPDKRFSCMSAYCIFVQDLTDKCGMEYDCGPGVQAFFSLYCFGEPVY